MSADFWRRLMIDKRIKRPALAQLLSDAVSALTDAGCTQTRATRVNGPVLDNIWVEGWREVDPQTVPALDPDTLDPERQI